MELHADVSGFVDVLAFWWEAESDVLNVVVRESIHKAEEVLGFPCCGTVGHFLFEAVHQTFHLGAVAMEGLVIFVPYVGLEVGFLFSAYTAILEGSLQFCFKLSPVGGFVFCSGPDGVGVGF